MASSVISDDLFSPVLDVNDVDLKEIEGHESEKVNKTSIACVGWCTIYQVTGDVTHYQVIHYGDVTGYHSLVRCIGGSMDRWFGGSMDRSFSGLMDPWFDGSMVRWFDGSIMVAGFTVR